MPVVGSSTDWPNTMGVGEVFLALFGYESKKAEGGPLVEERTANSIVESPIQGLVNTSCLVSVW